MQEKVICATCSNNDLNTFNCIGSSPLEAVIQERNFFRYKKKDFIFKEHEKVTGFYCIKNGIVRTYKTSASGKEQTFKIEVQGKWIGFRDAISKDHYNHSTVCLDDVEACFISKESIQKLIESDGKFQIEAMKYLAEELWNMENRVYSMETKQIHSRLAELLIAFQNNAEGKNSELSINVTREVMATCIGTTTETLIRALADFKDRNWIKTEKNKIELLNLTALYNLSEATAV